MCYSLRFVSCWFMTSPKVLGLLACDKDEYYQGLYEKLLLCSKDMVVLRHDTQALLVLMKTQVYLKCIPNLTRILRCMCVDGCERVR